MPEEIKNCWNCKFKKRLPGDEHINCSRALDIDKADMMIKLMSIFGSGVTMTHQDHLMYLAIMKIVPDFKLTIRRWPGCGIWPIAYDPNIVNDCSGYEPYPVAQPV